MQLNEKEVVMLINNLFYAEHHKRLPIENLLKDLLEANTSVSDIIAALATNRFATQDEAYLIAFKYACYKGLQDLFSALLEKDIVRNNITMMNNTPLREVACSGKVDMFMRLLAIREVAENANASYNSALEHAATNGYSRIVAELLRCNCVVESLNDTSADTPEPQEQHIISAFINGHQDVVAQLLPFPGQRAALEEFLNEHMLPYSVLPNGYRGDLDILFAPCDKHPIFFPSLEIYRKASAMLSQPARELNADETAILSQKKRSGVLKNSSDELQVRQVLNIPGTQLNPEMTSLHNAIKIRQ